MEKKSGKEIKFCICVSEC